MKSASSQQSPDPAAPQPKPLLVLGANRDRRNGKAPVAGAAVAARATPTQNVVGSNRQTASVRFRSETRLEYKRP